MSNSDQRHASPLLDSAASWRSNFSWQIRDRWQVFSGEARTRILVWYVLILTLAFGISIPVFRQLLFANIDTRVRSEMMEELEDFRSLLSGSSDFEGHTPNNLELEELPTRSSRLTTLQPVQLMGNAFPPVQLVRHVNLSFQSPNTEAQLKRFFDAYMAHRVPDDDVYFIAFVGGRFYKSSPRGRPVDLHQDAAFMRRWMQRTQPEQGERLSDDPNVGSILYLVEPIQHQNQPLGVFVIAHATAGERAEGLDATLVAAQVAFGVLLLALLLAWAAVGWVLRPLQALATTVETINASELTRRIPVQGKGELSRLATRFNDMMNRVETAFITQQEFVNDAGHELRTPITIIRGHLELMDVESIEQQETMTIVLDELDRMSRFIDDLILLAKAERPDFLRLETIEAAALTQALFAKAQALAPRHWNLEEVAQGQITVDRQRITQAIMNLVHNATQHTKTTDTITIGSAIGKGKIHFWVRDTGTGIALTDQKRIFARFARAAHQHRRSDGAGLGLSIVRAIAITHGGEVTVRSQLGSGSTFAVILPLKPLHQGSVERS